MGVFDNAQRVFDGEGYLKDALQVLGRGVQGIGLEHTRPFESARATNALRVVNDRPSQDVRLEFRGAKPRQRGRVPIRTPKTSPRNAT